MHSRIKAEITALARATPAVEVCGFVYGDLQGQAHLLPCRNIAAEPEKHFEIDVQDHVRALRLGTLFGVYHSHPGAPAGFSRSSPERPDELGDIDFADEIALPLYLVNVQDGSWLDYVPATYQVPLEARHWCLGFSDCWETPRIYYRQKFGIHMADYERDESYCHEERGTIMANYEREGFVRVDGGPSALRAHDILLFHSEKLLPQHFGVFVGRGGHFLHHIEGALSVTELLTPAWTRRIVAIFRHRSLS